MSYQFILLNALMIKGSIAMTNPDQEVACVNVFILSPPPPAPPLS
jgi:hypothetical protein